MLLENLDDRLASSGGLGEQRRCMRKVVGAEHDVDVTRARDDLVPVLLREAAPDCDLQTRTPVLQRLQMTEMPVQFVVGVLTDATGVEHDDVGSFEIVGGFHPVRLEETRDALRIVFVHLTPEGANVEALGHRRILRDGPATPPFNV